MLDAKDLTNLAQKIGDTELVKNQANKAVEVTYVYSTAIIKPGRYPIKDAQYGSGTFVTIRDKKGILTNWHVAKAFMNNDELIYNGTFYRNRKQKISISRNYWIAT